MNWILILIILSLKGLPGREINRTFLTEDEYDKYTSVGNLGLTITNFGILGNGWNKMEDGTINPSCQYKQNTQIIREQIEHFSYCGLWIGGIVNGQRRVSTAIVDGVFESGSEGFELFSNSSIQIKSSIASTTQDSMAKYYTPDAISHQDIISTFKDYNTDMEIPNHLPLGIDIKLESYAWNYSYADAFVILNYQLKNASSDTIKNIYAGIWADASVANFNYTDYYTPGGGFTWYDNLNGFDKSIDISGYIRDIAYQYDADGDDGWAQSYIGISVLGSNVPNSHISTFYNQWVWTNSSNTDYPAFSMPINDYERYQKLSSNVPLGSGDGYTSDGYPASENSWMFLVSSGPIGSVSNIDSTSWFLPPGDSCQIVFAVVCALWEQGEGEDSPQRRSNLHVNYDWAQKAYNGEDSNRNNILDEGEDTNDNQVLDRYILPSPPPSPNMFVDVGSKKATLYWQKNAESFVDPISREKDFEGYKIYGATKTKNDSLGEFSLLLQADIKNEIGYNSGLSMIQILNENNQPDSIYINEQYYHYKFENVNIKDGWLNYYSITAYDRGDPNSNLQSLESSIYSNRTYIYPGSSELLDSIWEGSPSVYPNPYKGQALWDGYSSREKMIWFRNLPNKAEIRIFSLAGDLVDIIQHDESYNGNDIVNVASKNNPKMSGGEHAWDMITMYDQATASGLYLFTVENKYTGEFKEGKFLIIK